MRFEAVIFDMDGVLIDSELYWRDIEKEFFGLYGIEFDKEMQLFMQGRSEIDCMKWFKDKFHISDDVDNIMEKRNNLSEKIYSSLCHPLPGIDDVLKKLKSENFTTAVASSTSLGRINVIVNRFNWKKYFNQLISAQGMPFSGKPEPDVYLYSAKLLGVNPKSCLVFEDSVNGVLSAKAAGMFCVGIPNPKWNTSRLEKADFVIDSFFDNKVNEILGI